MRVLKFTNLSGCIFASARRSQDQSPEVHSACPMVAQSPNPISSLSSPDWASVPLISLDGRAALGRHPTRGSPGVHQHVLPLRHCAILARLVTVDTQLLGKRKWTTAKSRPAQELRERTVPYGLSINIWMKITAFRSARAMLHGARPFKMVSQKYQ